MAKGRTYTSDLKTQVVLLLLAEKMSISQACQKYQLKSQVISRWKTEFLEKAHQIFETKEFNSREQERVAELERLVGRLTMELEILKKASNLWGSR